VGIPLAPQLCQILDSAVQSLVEVTLLDLIDPEKASVDAVELSSDLCVVVNALLDDVFLQHACDLFREVVNILASVQLNVKQCTPQYVFSANTPY